jgi:hypothetical protein
VCGKPGEFGDLVLLFEVFLVAHVLKKMFNPLKIRGLLSKNPIGPASNTGLELKVDC